MWDARHVFARLDQNSLTLVDQEAFQGLQNSLKRSWAYRRQFNEGLAPQPSPWRAPTAAWTSILSRIFLGFKSGSATPEDWYPIVLGQRSVSVCTMNISREGNRARSERLSDITSANHRYQTTRQLPLKCLHGGDVMHLVTPNRIS